MQPLRSIQRAAKPIRPDRPFFDFDNLLRHTASGQLVFNSPTEMNIDETIDCSLLAVAT